MSGLGKGKANVTAYIPQEMAAYLKVRGNLLEWSMSEIVGGIITTWIAAGAPSLHPTDPVTNTVWQLTPKSLDAELQDAAAMLTQVKASLTNASQEKRISTRRKPKRAG